MQASLEFAKMRTRRQGKGRIVREAGTVPLLFGDHPDVQIAFTSDLEPRPTSAMVCRKGNRHVPKGGKSGARLAINSESDTL
jgi:hypothetical protein